jgi:hypothetical protein
MQTIKRYRIIVTMLLLWAFVLGASTAPPQAQALSPGRGIGDLVKMFGVGWVVERFSGQINNAINSALSEHQAAIEGATKVVPIVHVGTGGNAIGAAQVMGPQAQVEKVEAVAEVELQISGTLRARGLVPVSTRDVRTVESVAGVGVSANVRFPL